MDETVLFGRYRLIEPAGRGGTAEVWRAFDERTGEEVAVKRLHPVVFGSDAGRERLVREFRSLRDLRHPGIVRVRDLEMGRDEAALILDFVPGLSLRDRLARDGAVPLDETVRIISDVAAGLSAAHAAGLVHRDVSPGNVLLGPDGHARLTDFGIARASSDDTGVTGTGVLVGTLRYVAPEQLRGERATAVSDVFGLAAIAWEMLAGRPAFPAATPVALVEAQRAGPPPLEGVPPEVDAVIRSGLAADPADRPATAAGFAAALSAAASATDPTAVTSVVAVPLGSAGSVAPAIAAGAATPQDADAARDDDAVPVSRTPPSRARARPIAAGAALALGALVLAAAALGGPAGDSTAGNATDAPAATTPAPTEPPAATEPPPVEPADQGGGDGGNEGGGNGDDKPDKDDDKDDDKPGEGGGRGGGNEGGGRGNG